MPRIRQHVNPLKSDLLEIADVPRVAAAAGHALDVELWAAEAHFLVDLARVDRDTTFVGVEIRRELVTFTNGELAKAGLPNVRLVFANMSVDMPRLFAPGSVRRFFLNFPDPWFKTRQHKRRVIGPELMEEIHRALAPGGELFVQTDIFDLAMDAMGALEALAPARFVNTRAPWSFLPANPYPAKSRRERQCEGDGSRIWRLLYQHRDPERVPATPGARSVGQSPPALG
jgi:tRNA (guanine-N7-)-methyltransferase